MRQGKPRKAGDTITKNLTFSEVVINKADEIMAARGEEFSPMCARLINEEYDRHFPCNCRDGVTPKPTVRRLIKPTK